jgi:hypothetical protein
MRNTMVSIFGFDFLDFHCHAPAGQQKRRMIGEAHGHCTPPAAKKKGVACATPFPAMR